MKLRSCFVPVELFFAKLFCKIIFESAKLAYANKVRNFSTSKKLCCHDFLEIDTNVLIKGNSVNPVTLFTLQDF